MEPFMPSAPLRYILRPARVALVIAQHHLCHEGFANELEISRQYWSQVFNRHRALSPKLRRALLRNDRLKGIPEAELWDVSVVGEGDVSCAAK